MILDFKMKKIIEELKEKYDFVVGQDCIVIQNDEVDTQLVYSDTGVLVVSHPSFNLASEKESDQKLMTAFFADPFNYHEWAYHKMGELIRHFYVQRKKRNLILKRINHADMNITFTEDGVSKRIRIYPLTSTIREYII